MKRLRKDLLAPTEGEIRLGITRALIRAEREAQPYPCLPYACDFCHTRFLLPRHLARTGAKTHYCSKTCQGRGMAKLRLARKKA